MSGSHSRSQDDRPRPRQRRQADPPADSENDLAGVSQSRLSKHNTTAPCLPLSGARIAFSTDSYVVHPIFFPGGNIGDLAVNGTVNDLSMCGATPQYLSASFIIEEGLPMDDFWRILCSMKAGRRRCRRHARDRRHESRSIAARATRFSSTRPASASCRDGSHISIPHLRNPAT